MLFRAAILALTVGIHLAQDVAVDIFGHSASLGASHICAISQRNNNDDIGGQATCWHDGHKDRDTWTAAPKDETFVQVTSGAYYGCGLNIEQNVVCWGFYKDLDVPGFYTQISGADYYGCGIKTDNGIGCWGSTPEAPPTEGKYVQVDCHNHHCCALTTEGYARCWGKQFGPSEAHAHLKTPIDERKKRKLEGDRVEEEEEDGYDDESDPEEAVAAMMKHTFTQLAVGDFFSCGITTDKKDALCWGEGKVARKHGVPHSIPGPFKQISVGEAGLCGIYDKPNVDDDDANGADQLPKENAMLCWGRKLNKVVDMKEVVEEEWDQVMVGKDNACGVTMNSELVCWGKGKEVANLPHGLVVA